MKTLHRILAVLTLIIIGFVISYFVYTTTALGGGL